MHESRLVENLIRKIETLAIEAGSPRVRAVELRLGALAEMGPDHFRRHFEYAAQGTLVEKASLLIRISDRVDDPIGSGVLLESVTLVE